MQHLLAGLTALFPALGMIGSLHAASEEDDEAVVTRVLTDCYSAFSTLDVQAILPYFHEPCLIVAPQGVAVAPTHSALGATLAPGMEAFRARGYARSELTMLHVKCLSASTALAAGVAVRYKTDGQELDRAGVIYLLQRVDGSWKIAVIAVHDADDRLRLE